MNMKVLYLKNMDGIGYRLQAKKILDKMGIAYVNIDLRSIELLEPLSANQLQTLKEILKVCGVEIMEDHKEILVEKIKSSVIEMVKDNSCISALKTSYYLSKYLKYNYTYLANVFSQHTGICLTDFIIAQKIEKAKEMLVYEELSVTEIAWKLNYSSVAHLSNQFTKVTGLRPSQFKKINRNALNIFEQNSMLEAV